MTRNTSVRISIITLALCLSTGCPKKAEEQMIEKCEAVDIIRMGEYVLVNDDDRHPAYAQCIFEDRREGTFGWTWEAITPAPQQGSVTTSAYVFYGQSTSGGGAPPSVGESSTTPALPILLEDLDSLTIEYDVRVSSTSRYSIGVRTDSYFCFVGSCGGSSLGISLYSDYSYSSAYFQNRITIDGADYDFYVDTSDLSFSHFWFVKVTPSHTGTLDVYAFLKYLDEEGYGWAFSQIAYLEFSQTVWDGGAGSTTFHTYSINVTPRAQ